MSPQSSPPCRSNDAELLDGGLPDMIELVRFATLSGRAPALVVSHRKMSDTLLARLRRLADETRHET